MIGGGTYTVAGSQLLADGGGTFLYKQPSDPEGQWPRQGQPRRRFFSVRLVGQRDEEQEVRPLSEAEAAQLYEALPRVHVDEAWAFAGLIARENVSGRHLYRASGRRFFVTESADGPISFVEESEARRLHGELRGDHAVPFADAFGP
jgi:hypothetical protein